MAQGKGRWWSKYHDAAAWVLQNHSNWLAFLKRHMAAQSNQMWFCTFHIHG